jgi:hypothetical protein
MQINVDASIVSNIDTITELVGYVIVGVVASLLLILATIYILRGLLDGKWSIFR